MSGGEVVGDPKLKITGAASLAEATSEEISFFGNRKYIGLLRKTRASAVFVPTDFAEPLAAAQVRVSDPTKAFEQVMLKFAPKPITFAPGIHPSAIVGSNVRLGERVSIQPHVPSSKTVPKSGMTQLLALEVTLDMKRQSAPRA